MHTHTLYQKALCHRHWVGLPLFVLMLLGSSLPTLKNAIGSVRGDMELVLEADGKDQKFQYENGHSGVAYSGSHVTATEKGVSVEQGSVLAHSNGFLSVTVADVTVTGYQGASHITRSSDSLTVAALSTSIVVTSGDTVIIVPEGMQGTWPLSALDADATVEAFVEHEKTLLEVPADLISEYLAVLPEAVSTAAEISQAIPDLRESHERTEMRQSLHELAELVEQGQPAAVSQFIAEHASQLELDPAFTTEAIRTIIHVSHPQQGVLAELLPYLEGTPEGLLASFHPALSAAEWVRTQRDRNMEWKSLRVLAFLLADTTKEAASSLVTDRWAQEAQELLASTNDPLQPLSGILSIADTARNKFVAAGYPERHERYRQILHALTEPYALQLTDEQREMLNAWDATQLPSLEDVAVQEAHAEEAVVEPVEATPFDAAALEATAAELVRQSQALMGLATSFTATSAEVVQVKGIVYSGPEGDRAYEFDLHLPTREALNILQDGTQLPYPMLLTQLSTWARGQE